MTRPVYIALVHHPVKDRAGDVITTSVTNIDVHDIARSTRTYGLAGYFITSPISAQHAILERILEHWQPGAKGTLRVPKRGEALALVRPVRSLDEAVEAVTAAHDGTAPEVWVTSAQAPKDREVLGFAEASEILASRETPTLLVFGTGHGLTDATVAAADRVVAPVRGGRYNHLSVRAAVAIILDRLFGET